MTLTFDSLPPAAQRLVRANCDGEDPRIHFAGVLLLAKQEGIERERARCTSILASSPSTPRHAIQAIERAIPVATDASGQDWGDAIVAFRTSKNAAPSPAPTQAPSGEAGDLGEAHADLGDAIVAFRRKARGQA